jgi:hypothetical protein
MHFSSLFSTALLIQVSAAWTIPQFVLVDPVEPICQCNLGTNGTDYVWGDSRLGPVELPKTLILGTVMSRYDRFGMLTPIEFINTWWDVRKRKGKGGWNYPDNGGFLLDERGFPSRPI